MKLPTLATILLTAVALSAADAPKSVYDVSLKDIDGKDTSLKDYQGKVMLIVNVASKCGNTPQYKQLEELNQEFSKEGLAVLGFPCNDFGGQEPGTNEVIKEFCSTKYKVTFPMFDKVTCKGPNKSPLYQVLSGPESPFPGDVKWNFGKFLVGRDGKILKRFEPKVKPDSPEVVSAIKEALAAK
ncbi:glutathione peroxidase [Prosthecobacter sp.]|uniref:glutathione peroxidase n=1 Tax=Prosthecobacter sp. TaxID=1965333 RepID=UPI001DEEF7CC|nr:glutathione peroxidase [Prosthecobacter sp.]MCB1277878.1 glutathione peroxidase [Prosthecobacter sp.]